MIYKQPALFIYIALLGCNPLWAQNLVPNSDFSMVSGCPGDWSGSICPIQLFSCMDFWWSATPREPEEYHQCGVGSRGVPQQAFKYQQAKTGQGFFGFQINGTDSYSHRTMAECELLETMKANVDYYVYFYVNRRENFKGIRTYYDAIGAFFSDTIYLAKPEFDVPLEVPPPDIWAKDVIRDTVGWEKVSGCHTAIGGEQYMIIGNMKRFEQLKTEPGSGEGSSVYYYVDDVGVFAFDPLPDTLLICRDEVVPLSAEFLDADIVWPGNLFSSTYEVSTEGRLIVEARMEDCILRDTALVVQLPDDGTFSEVELIACPGDSVVLDLCLPGDFTWVSGSVGEKGLVFQPGIYRAVASTKCGVYECIYDVIMPTCDCPIYIPTAFSPNYDGINDIFIPELVCEWPIENLQFEIFDRWGNLVHRETGPYLVGWDGTYQSAPMDPGVFTWVLSYNIQLPNSSPIFEKKAGEIHLIR